MVGEIKLKEPLSARALSTREQIILLEASKLHGCRFPPWKSSPDASEFNLSGDQLLFTYVGLKAISNTGTLFMGPSNYRRDDDAQLRLSKTQLAVCDGWKRPGDVFPQLTDMPSWVGPVMSANKKVDLVQDVTSDCSVVASLCAITARFERGHSQILSSVIYPYDRTLEQPTISKNGKYIFRLYFNGCWRKVVIDDRLPASSGSRALHVLDRNNPGLLWPALIEKAYLKVRGGYDFPGSNSGSDLWVLTGWIPEHVFLYSDTVNREALWHRISKAYGYGDVLVTLGTGQMTDIESRSTGLVSEHDYAVIDAEERNGRRMFRVKNPWSEGGGWIAAATSVAEHDVVDQELQPEMPEIASEKGLGLNSNMEPGIFWMDVTDIFQHFESLYLNWNPGLFSYRDDLHFSWDLTKSNGQWASFANNPQYRLQSEAGGTVWLLLSRHFRSTYSTTNYSVSSSLAASVLDTGFISLYLFHARGDKVYLSDGSPIRGPYVDSPNTLLKVELSKGVPYTVVVSEQELHRSSHSFTLSILSLQPVDVSQARDRYRSHIVRHGAWTSATAGGNANSPLYSKNPQFMINLPNPSDVSLLLEVDTGEAPVHVKLLWTDGKPVRYLTTRDIIGDSGEYRKGHAYAEIFDVPAGCYTIICSTFEQGQLGQFTLRIATMTECTLQRLSTRPAGQFVCRLEPAYFGAEVDRLWTPLRCSRLTRLSAVAQSHEAAGTPSSQRRSSNLPLKLSLEHGQGSMKRILAISGNDEFSNGHYGVQVNDVDIRPDMCAQAGIWIVLERAGPLDSLLHEGIDVEIYSDALLDTETWYGS
ncbi:MAG: hypothetical protein Q9201_002176 [Fulgogasparrea decipioides]